MIGDGAPTNGAPLLPEASDGTRIYFALPEAIVELVYSPNASANRLRKTGEARIDFRANRTGTTPSILFGSDGSKWIIAVDARCAIENPFSGTIECDQGLPPEQLSPSRLVAFKLPFEGARNGRILSRSVELPDIINTVENSPAVANNTIVVTNYPGFVPTTAFGAEIRFQQELGVAAVNYEPNGRGTGQFARGWTRDDIQISGVPSISTGSGLVYGSGTVLDALSLRYDTFYYGLDLASGITVFSTFLSNGFQSAPGAGDQIFDPGNANAINKDGSIFVSAGSNVVRIRD